MGFDVEIGLSILTTLVLRQAQVKLGTTCLPVFADTYMDSINVLSISSDIKPDSINFTLNLELLLVSQEDLDKGFDPDMTVESAQMVLQMAINGTNLQITLASITAPSPAFQLIADQLVAQFGTLVTVDLSNIFSTLGTGTPSTSRFESIGNTVMIRFDPTDPAVDHLGPTGYQWCLFLGANTMETLVLDIVTPAGVAPLSAESINPDPPFAKWAPQGGQGHVDARITGQGDRGCATIHALETFHIDFYVPGRTVVSQLVKVVNFDVHLDTGNVAGPFGLDHYLNEKAAAAVANFDPTKIGGVRLGDPGTPFGEHNFSITTTLFPSDPNTGAPGRLQIGTATLNLTASAGLADGLALGGSVTLGDPPDLFPLSVSTNIFPNTFTQYVFCTPGETGRPTVLASTDIQHTGHLCDVTVITPTSPDVTQFMSVIPAPGTDTDSVSISFLITDLAAIPLAATNQPLVLRVRTTRGVRNINFGKLTPPEYADDGTMLNLRQVFVGNCPQAPISPGSKGWRFGIKGHGWLPDPPPIWWNAVEQTAGFQVSLASVRSEEPVVFRQPVDGGETVVAAKAGMVRVPMAVAVRGSDEDAVLESLSRGPLGKVSVESKMFRRAVTLARPGAVEHRLIAGGVTARVLTRFKHRFEITEIDRLGMANVVENFDGYPYQYQDAFMSPAVKTRDNTPPLPDLQGLSAIHSVPGFEDSGISIAELEDGALRILAKEGNEYSVTGILPRWPKIPPTVGRWAISSTIGDRIAIFHVEDTTVKGSGQKKCGCECKCGSQA